MMTTATASLLLWGIPMIITIAVWVLVNARPVRSCDPGGFDFGGAFTVFARFVFCIVCTLLIWLVTFAVAYLTA